MPDPISQIYKPPEQQILGADQPQNVTKALHGQYHTPEQFPSINRLFQFHLIMIYFFWICVAVFYNTQDKVDLYCSLLCAKCRGDGEFEYDSEVDSEEETNKECKQCVQRDNEKHIRFTKIREMTGIKNWKDNNMIDRNDGE